MGKGKSPKSDLDILIWDLEKKKYKELDKQRVKKIKESIQDKTK